MGVLAALLGLSSAALFISSRRQMALQVDETGFRLIGSAREKPVTRWCDVTEFRIVRVAGHHYIGYPFSVHSSRTKVPDGVMLLIAGFVDPPLDAVAELLQACRRQFGQPTSRPPEPADEAPGVLCTRWLGQTKNPACRVDFRGSRPS
nr:hypothetical protein [Burkholderia sp. MSMB1078WGS]